MLGCDIQCGGNMTRTIPGSSYPKNAFWRKPGLSLCGLALAALLTSCATTPEPPETPPAPVPAEFKPAAYYSRILADTGNYPTLFSPDSFAIWVTDDVIELKKQQALSAGESIDIYTDRAAAQIGENFYVFECHTESVFADSSIAYDVVGLRNVDAYLLLPDDTKVAPLQRLVGNHADEEQRGALKLFRRTNILVFPKTDLFSGAPTIPPAAGSVRLVLEGHGSTFFFQWPAQPIPEEDLPPVPEAEKRGALKVGFDELMSKIRALIRIID